MAYAADIERKARLRQGVGRRNRNGKAHEMNPFCQTSRRSRAMNNSRTTPEQSTAMISSVA
jgi:hypothetical protein